MGLQLHARLDAHQWTSRLAAGLNLSLHRRDTVRTPYLAFMAIGRTNNLIDNRLDGTHLAQVLANEVLAQRFVVITGPERLCSEGELANIVKECTQIGDLMG